MEAAKSLRRLRNILRKQKSLGRIKLDRLVRPLELVALTRGTVKVGFDGQKPPSSLSRSGMPGQADAHIARLPEAIENFARDSHSEIFYGQYVVDTPPLQCDCRNGDGRQPALPAPPPEQCSLSAAGGTKIGALAGAVEGPMPLQCPTDRLRRKMVRESVRVSDRSASTRLDWCRWGALGGEFLREHVAGRFWGGHLGRRDVWWAMRSGASCMRARAATPPVRCSTRNLNVVSATAAPLGGLPLPQMITHFMRRRARSALRTALIKVTGAKGVPAA